MAIHFPDHLILAANAPEPVADHRYLSRAAARGELTRIKRGAYMDASAWAAARPEEKHLARVIAFSRSHPGAVFSHHSAAVLLGLPLVGGIPSRVQVIAQRAAGGRSEPGLQRRCIGFFEDEVQAAICDFADDILCTTPARTVMDLATVQEFRFAVAPLDHVLRSGTASALELAEHVDRRGKFRGEHRIRRVLAFGDARAQFPGESVSRAVIHELGFPLPDLQVKHPAPGGGFVFTDFEWPSHRVIGEFDGRSKYLKEEYLDGRSPGETVHDEKIREDSLREADNTVRRWGWNDALARLPVREKLLSAGLPIVRTPMVPVRARSRGRT